MVFVELVKINKQTMYTENKTDLTCIIRFTYKKDSFVKSKG